jgi:hypothetical protein
MKFEPMGKIPRLSRNIVVTEKLDGTNASIAITPFTEIVTSRERNWAVWFDVSTHMYIYAGSRSRWLDTSSKGDNYGFAKWVETNAQELMKLGPGHHFGEWWGAGIQRGYGLDHKRFSLFNTHRWGDSAVRPACCDVVPVLYQGEFTISDVEITLGELRRSGSQAAPGFMNPEGVVIYHTAGNYLFKKTLEKDDEPKSKS